MLTPRELKTLLAKHGVRLTKRLGQNHLVNPSMIERFVAACELSPGETVVEIGAGLGALTEPLAHRASRVIAVEVDRRICQLLRDRMAPLPSVSVECQDILAFSWERVGSMVVVGAIPYSLTSPIFISLCEHRAVIRRAMLILQREVANRLLAVPGTKAYGRLSLLAQYCWRVTSAMNIPRHAFFPQPNVDSTGVRLVAHATPPVLVEDEPFFFEVIKAAFAHRRKSLVNCLSGDPRWHANRIRCEHILQRLQLSPSIRGEMLSLEQFALLANALRSEIRK